MNNNLYTFVVDYAEGTFVSQTFAKNQDDALLNWVNQVDFEEMEVKDTKEEITTQIKEEEEEPMLLEGLENVWCVTINLDSKLAIINIIETQGH